MNIIEFFQTLFTHRAIIRRLEQQVRDEHQEAGKFATLSAELDGAVHTLAHALVYIATPVPEPEPEAPLKPIRLQRMSYSEAARSFERANSARFRDQDAERARKAAIANR